MVKLGEWLRECGRLYFVGKKNKNNNKKTLLLRILLLLLIIVKKFKILRI